MASLEVNKLLPIIAGVVVIGLGLIVFVVARDKSAISTAATAGESVAIPEPREVDADNTTDTIRALSGHVTKLQGVVEETTAMSEQMLKDKNKQLSESEQRIESVRADFGSQLQEASSLSAQTNELILSQFESMKATIANLQEEVLQASKRAEAAEQKASAPRAASEFSLENITNQSDMLPGLGMDSIASGEVIEGLDLLDVIWVNPLDRKGSPPPGGWLPDAEGALQRGANKILPNLPAVRQRDMIEVRANGTVQPVGKPAFNNTSPDGQRREEAGKPDQERFFTLPDLSTLTDALSLTSLVGRVYPDGEVTDPWPFKVMIGKENLTANYAELPNEIDGMLFEGYAIGDWTLGCVRGWITAATFVFRDGVTVSAYSNTPGARPSESRLSEAAIGYVSDRYGNVCVRGIKTTDAPKFLATRGLAAGLAGYATALNAENELRRTSVGEDGDVSTIISVLDGSRDYAANSALASAFQEGADWIKERQKQSFDAVYVPPGEIVAINLQAELWLDKIPDARQIRYSQTTRHRHETID